MSVFRTKAARNMALYVDRKVVVLNKPPGIVSQTTATDDAQRDRNPNNTTQSHEAALTRALDDVATAFELQSRPLPVHRIDKSTTGALLLARTPQSAKDLSQQFAANTVHKTYLALVRGGRKTFVADSGEINVGLKIDDGRVSVSNRGKEARTSWELLESSSNAPLSLLRLTLHTGLKHQLRVHLAHSLNAPILGDDLYSRSDVSDKIRSMVTLPKDRLFLHASHISFLRYRPWGQAKQFRLGVTSPLPPDFLEICIQAGFTLDARTIRGGVTIDDLPAPEGLSDIQGRWVGPQPPVT